MNGQNGSTNGDGGVFADVVVPGSKKGKKGISFKAEAHEPKLEAIYSEEDIRLFKQQFDVFDTDGSGKIDEKEFVLCCTRMGMDEAKALQLKEQADTDDDGFVDFQEFLKLDVVGQVLRTFRSQRQGREQQAAKAESQTHVNVARIVSVVRAKIDNSRLAFSFARYLCFLILYAAVVLLQRAPIESMSMSAALQNYFVGSQYHTPNGYELKGWLDIRTLDEFWDWHEYHFLELFYVNRYYNNDFFSPVDQSTILQHIKLTGGFRMMQRRIENGTCWSYDKFVPFQPDCYGEIYFEGTVGPLDRLPFTGVKSGKEYVFEEKAWYDYGYFVNFDRNKTAGVEQLKELRRDLWIGKATQFYRLDFVLYNPNVGQFATMEFKAQMRPTGIIIPYVEVYCRRYDFYLTQRDWIRLAMEAILFISFFFFVYGEWVDAMTLASRHGKRFAYFNSFWNIIDFIHYLLFLIVMIIWVYIIADPSVRKLVIEAESITMESGLPVDFTATVIAVESYFAINGFNMLIAVIRILKYLRMNAFLGQLTDALELMRDGLVQFAIVLFIVIFMFTAIGVILFGRVVPEFTNALDAIDMVLGFTVGFADPAMLFEYDKLYAVFFYYPFIFLMSLFVLPLTIAVIMDGYGEMQAAYQRAKRSNLHDVVELMFPEQMYRGFIRSTQFFVRNKEEHKRLKFPPKEEVLKLFGDLSDRDVVAFSEVRKKFRDKNITESLLTAICEKYNAFQPDPEWNHLLKEEEDVEDEAKKEKLAKEDNDPDVLSKIIEELNLRTDQVLEDQHFMNKKLDLLCEIFPTTAVA
mmetsp:Transcript_12990/g.25934  ORF Transcript_12990/g.25934 Transcript_12990/m.25934 type:complete len:803 (+) Transcript_12990:147-2555(+)